VLAAVGIEVEKVVVERKQQQWWWECWSQKGVDLLVLEEAIVEDEWLLPWRLLLQLRLLLVVVVVVVVIVVVSIVVVVPFVSWKAVSIVAERVSAFLCWMVCRSARLSWASGQPIEDLISPGLRRPPSCCRRSRRRLASPPPAEVVELTNERWTAATQSARRQKLE
jgi:hypothetical protein